MNFNVASMPPELLWGSWAVLLGLLPVVVWRAPWRDLMQGNRFHYWAGAVLVVSLAWSLKGSLAPGFDLHLIGATVLVLMFRLPLALCALVPAVALASFNTGGEWQAFALNLLCAAWLPAAIAGLWLRWTQRVLPHNYFVYLFVTACGGAALSVLGVGACATVLLATSGPLPLEVLFGDYTLFYVLLAFSEAWLSGMAITLMVVWRPAWVITFDDASYLGRR